MSSEDIATQSENDVARRRQEYFSLVDELQTKFEGEDFFTRLKRKMWENPLVPIGALTTVAVLRLGLKYHKSGNVEMSQKMMRARVLAQGFTFTVILAGIYIAAWREMQKRK